MANYISVYDPATKGWVPVDAAHPFPVAVASGGTGGGSTSTSDATAANQAAGNTSLSNIDGKVATAAKQDTGNTSLSSIDGKVATAAAQTTGNTSLASIDTKMPAKGQAVAASSQPVVLPAIQEASLKEVTIKRPATVSAPTSYTLVAATSTQILAANTARRGAMITNRSGQPVFLKYGTAASATSYHWFLNDTEKYEVPFGITAVIHAFSVNAGAAPGVMVGEVTD